MPRIASAWLGSAGLGFTAALTGRQTEDVTKEVRRYKPFTGFVGVQTQTKSVFKSFRPSVTGFIQLFDGYCFLNLLRNPVHFNPVISFILNLISGPF